MDAGARAASGPAARIDVTPMADVMIVLLIIFMVTTPAIVAGGVRLPAARHADAVSALPTVIVGASGMVTLEGSPPLPPELVETRLAERLAALPEGERVVSLRADRGADYADVRAALAVCRAAGADRVALATLPSAERLP